MKERVKRIFFNSNFDWFEEIAPTIGLRLLGIGLSDEEQYNIKRELIEKYKESLSVYDYYECKDYIIDELYKSVEPIVYRLINTDRIYKETYYDGKIFSKEYTKEEFAMHIAKAIAESGCVDWGLNDLILCDLVELDIDTRENLLKEIVESTKWYNIIYTEAKDEILDTLNSMIEERGVNPGDDLSPIINTIAEERKLYRR